MMRQLAFARVISLAAIATSMLCAPAQAADDAQRLRDWKRAAELFGQYYSDLNSQYAFTGHEDEYLALWEKWSKELPALQADLKQRYGDTPEAVAAEFEGLSAPEGVGNGMRQIAGDLLDFDLAAKRKEIAGWCVTSGDEHYAKWKAFTAPDTTKLELKVDYAKRALASYERARRIEPDGDYTDRVKKAKEAIAESEKAWRAALRDLKWPGHNRDFEGPGHPDKLAREAVKFLSSVKSWSKPEYDDVHIPVAACITAKGWAVSKTTPVTKVPTQYSLDVLVAFKGTRDPDIAYAYHMVFYTREEEGVKKEPPFRYVNSRQYAKYRMLMANVPKGARVKVKPAGAATGGDTVPPSAGFIGLIFRLLLAAGLLTTGLACASVLEKVKALTALRGALDAHRQTLGMALLIVGLLSFLRTTLLFFAPHADLLPQLLAVVLGLALAHSSLPEPVAARIRGPAAKLTVLLPQLGVAALALGLLHLLLAGVVLL